MSSRQWVPNFIPADRLNVYRINLGMALLGDRVRALDAKFVNLEKQFECGTRGHRLRASSNCMQFKTNSTTEAPVFSAGDWINMRIGKVLRRQRLVLQLFIKSPWYMKWKILLLSLYTYLHFRGRLCGKRIIGGRQWRKLRRQCVIITSSDRHSSI